MGFTLELFTSKHVAAAERFNERLRRAGGDPSYLLPREVSPAQTAPEDTPFLTRQWVLLDGPEARGGVRLQELECVVGPQVERAANIQTPITEGAFHSNGAHLGPVLLKLIGARFPLLYAVGMGSLDRPFPRLLRALRWHLVLSGFFFRAGHGSRLFRELAPLRKPGILETASSAAALLRLGGPLLRLAHAIYGWKSRRFRLGAQTLRARPIDAWGEWATMLWDEIRPDLSCAAVRDVRTLPFLHPLHHGPLHAFRLDDAGGDPAGWMVLLCTSMNEGHFGRLRVGTIIDALTRPGLEEAALSAATRTLLDLGAELLIANHTHRAWMEAFRRSGYLGGPSNYVFAASPPLATAWKKQDHRSEHVLVTRADGDGRIHL